MSDYDFGAALAGSANSQISNRHADWGPCISDTRHNFNTGLVAASSFKFGNVWANRLLNDWQIAPAISARSGQPWSAGGQGNGSAGVSSGIDNSRTGLSNDRPDQVLGNVYAPSQNCGTSKICVQWLNPAAFVQNPVGTYGNVGRNAERAPGNFSFDVSLSRKFKINERFSLQARAEAFNIMNHTNYVGGFQPTGLPAGLTYGTGVTALNQSTFGQVTGAFDPRILQFAMKLFF